MKFILFLSFITLFSCSSVNSTRTLTPTPLVLVHPNEVFFEIKERVTAEYVCDESVYIPNYIGIGDIGFSSNDELTDKCVKSSYLKLLDKHLADKLFWPIYETEKDNSSFNAKVKVKISGFKAKIKEIKILDQDTYHKMLIESANSSLNSN